jgi:hypothetical protein
VKRKPKRTYQPLGRLTVHTGGQKVAGLPFQGETMTCVCCDRSGQSDPAIESNWRAIQVSGRTYYACPQEFPPDGSSQLQFTEAYTRVLNAIVDASKRRAA